MFSVQGLLLCGCLPSLLSMCQLLPLDRGCTDAVTHVFSQANGGIGWYHSQGPWRQLLCARRFHNSRGSDWHHFLDLSVPVVVCVAPRACIGSVLKSETVCVGKEALKAVLPFPLRDPYSGTLPLWQVQASSSCTFGCGCTILQPFRPSLHSQPQHSPWVWPPKPEVQHPAPTCTGRHMSQTGQCRAATPTVCVGLRFAFSSQLLHSPLRLQSSHSVLADLSAGAGTSQDIGTFALSWLPSRVAGPVLIPFSFFFPFVLSYLVMWKFSSPFRSLEFFCQCSVGVLWELFHV